MARRIQEEQCPIAAPHLGDGVWKGWYAAPGLVPLLADQLEAVRKTVADKAIVDGAKLK